MQNKLVIIFLALALFSQQAMAGFASASMMSSVPSDSASMEMAAMSHQHHAMPSESGLNEYSDSEEIDCCKSDCAYCVAGCQLFINYMASNLLSSFSVKLKLQHNPEPLSQPLATLFKPPIFA